MLGLEAGLDVDFRVASAEDTGLPGSFDITRESWPGRIRACPGVGATLSGKDVRRFDEAHTELLARIAPEAFTVLRPRARR